MHLVYKTENSTEECADNFRFGYILQIGQQAKFTEVVPIKFYFLKCTLQKDSIKRIKR